MEFSDYFDLLWNNSSNLIDKEIRTRDMVEYMLARTQQMFVWEGLPKTIPSYELELMLQTFGNVCITDVPGKGLYAFYGGLGGVPDAYYNPTIYTIANPYLNFNAQLEIDTDCVRVRNDRFGKGLLPLFIKYASMMNENEISMNMVSILYRISELISADDDKTYESAKAYLDDIVSGQFGVISSSEFFDGIRVDKTENKKSIKDLIEYEQYLKASWFNEIGLNSNYNMKRERIVASEAELNDDSLIPLVEDMLDWRQKGIEKVKELYGNTYNFDGLRVSLNYVWDLDNMYTSIPKESETGEMDETETEETKEMETETELTPEPENNAEIPTPEPTEETEQITENEGTQEITVETKNIIIEAENVEISERSENEETEDDTGEV